MRSRRRRGFTLIELMIVLVVTSLIALLAYSAARAGNDTQERLSSHQRDNEAISVAYQLVSDAFRHAEPGIRGGTDVFTITNVPGPTGERSQMLNFVSRGVLAPLGTSELWIIQLGPTPDGVTLTARPVSGSSTPIRTVLPSVVALQVRALPRSTGAFWTVGWPSPDIAPTAVELTFIPHDNARPIPPLVVRIGLERAP